MSADAAAGLARLAITERQSRMRCFVESAPDATIYFQIIDLGQQIYVWVAVGGAKLQNMYLAIQSKKDAIPAVATLVPDSASSGASSMAQRLARRTGRPVMCSCNLPAGADMLRAIAERRLCQELDSMGLSSSPTNTGGKQQSTGAATEETSSAALPDTAVAAS